MNREEMTTSYSSRAWEKWLFAAAIGLWIGFVISSAHGETTTVSSFGVGQTRQDAIDKALIQAVEQVTGVKIRAARAISESLVSMSDGGSSNSSRITEGFQQEARQQSGGAVKSFDIVAVDHQGDGFIARLTVSIERYAPRGLPTQDRRRIVIAQPENLAGLAPTEVALLRDALDSYLVQTRRFAVLDRQNSAAYQAEMELLKGPDVAVSETANIGQVIGADYALIATVRRLEATTQDIVLPVTGQRVSRQTASAIADFVIIETATRQVKWAGQSLFESVGDRDAALRGLASLIGDKVVSDIYPLRVIQMIGVNSVVINQGGDTIKVGQMFTANLLGDIALDPYTKEPLGRVELPIGTVKISRVDPKLSYGDLVSGALPTGDLEIILRASTPEHERHTEPSDGNTNTGTRPRW